MESRQVRNTGADAPWDIGFILAAYALTRVLLVALVCIPPYLPGATALEAAPFKDGPLAVLMFQLSFYDTANYLDIANNGYSPRQTPFFPLLPLLLRLGGGTLGAGIVVSQLCFLAALLALHRLWGRRAVLAASLAPVGVFFVTAYAESLFLALASGCLLAIRRDRWGWAALCAGLAGLTRPVGWTVVIALCFYLIGAPARRRRALMAFTLGLTSLYPLFLWLRFGDPLEFLRHQELRFTRRLMAPGWGVMSDLTHLWIGDVPAEWALLAVVNLLGLLLLFICLFSFRGVLDRQEFWLVTVLYLGLLLSTPVTDYAYLPATHASLRYAYGCPPVFALIARRPGLLLLGLPMMVVVTFMVGLKWFVA